LRLTKDQERKILSSYRWMPQALTQCAEERNNHILPQLSFESAGVHRVCTYPSSFTPCPPSPPLSFFSGSERLGVGWRLLLGLIAESIGVILWNWQT